MQAPDHIEDELKQFAPHLASLPKSHPFAVPKGYFEGLEMKLIFMVSKPDEHADILFGSKEYPFRVPDDYFKDLSSDILSKIKDETPQEREIRTAIAFTKYLYDYKSWIAAASVAAIVMISITFLTQKKPASLALQNTTIESVNDLQDAVELDEAVVVELYLRDQQDPDDSYENDGEDYLRDVVELNPEFMNEL